MKPTVFSQITSLFAPVHRDGHKFIALGAGVTVILFLIWSVLGLIGAIATVAIAFFFRDPERVTPVKPGLTVASADGLVLDVSPKLPPSELGLSSQPLPSLSTFLSLFDVHIIRSPVSGRITASVHRDGEHDHANAPGSDITNERHGFVITAEDGQTYGVVLIAGAFARRIVALAKQGDTVGAGDRIGLIRFGSRVDVYLPAGQSFTAAPGQRMTAGETIISDVNASSVTISGIIYKRG